ncbi:hypothetical protein [Halovivax limisalsi]|uniref:hypothetical protein n=1 Tax=Halovivax limisalsi TaxID=1453760 RepID=UPI001FFD902D|nr:hypothetical protein [Halovivax limisalsi]
MDAKDDPSGDIRLQLSPGEFQQVVQSAVQAAILDIMIFLAGLAATWMFVIMGLGNIVDGPGLHGDVFGVLSIGFGLFIFWLAVLDGSIPRRMPIGR